MEIHIYITHTHTHTHTYIYIYICVCVCVIYRLGGPYQKTVSQGPQKRPVFETEGKYISVRTDKNGKKHINFSF